MRHYREAPTSELIPKAVDRFEDYQYVEGELVASLALGWNFGDGHLHGPQLLRAIQAECGFEPGELRVVCVESQPLGRSTLDYRIYDAADGLRASGALEVARLCERQPWEAPRSSP